MSLVETQLADGIWTITLNRPEKRNAINWEAATELISAFDAAAQDSSVRVIIMRGAGTVFSAGIDLTDLMALPERYGATWQRQMRTITLDWQRLTNRIAHTELPVIAVLHGVALGLAFEIALACDFRLAAPDTRLGLPETRLGIIPDVGGTTRMTAILGPARAKELILTGRTIDAEQAAAWGLITAAAVDLEAAVQTLTDELKQAAPLAVGMAKRVIDSVADTERGLLFEGWAQSQLIRTADFAAGIQAAIQRRSAEFSGE